MRILIATGIYPPKIGGPAQYAKNLELELSKAGHIVSVATFGIENYIPTGIRHFVFFIKVLPKVLFADGVFILDTFSVAGPTVLACKLFRKKSVIRTGGAFLWEQYVERTGKKVLLRDFYKTEMGNLTFKERVIFNITKWILSSVSKVIFSTRWHRDIFISAYGLEINATSIVENYYGEKESDNAPVSKVFVASTRNLKWKNLTTLYNVFDKIKTQHPYVELFTDNLPYERFMEKISSSYAVIQVSLGDISPNMILDAIRYNRPFICTKEVGIYDRIKDIGVFVDPLNETEIHDAVMNLLEPDAYKIEHDKIKNFNYVHSWKNIADEFLVVLNNI